MLITSQVRLARPVVVVCLLALAALACTISLGGPDIPPDSAAPSPEALDSFNKKWLDLPERLTNGNFTVSFSDEEVASVVGKAIAATETANGNAIPLRNTRIDLEDDILLYAQTEGGLFNATGVMTLHPSVDPDGQLAAQVQSAEFGRASFDQALLDQIGATVAQALTDPLQNLPVSVVLTSVSVVENELVLTGTIIE